MINWIKNRLKERTTLDGGALIAVGVIALLFQGVFIRPDSGVIALLFKGLIPIAAYAAIAYGAWTIWKSE